MVDLNRKIMVMLSSNNAILITLGGDLASTWVAKLQVHAEDSTPRKIY